MKLRTEKQISHCPFCGKETQKKIRQLDSFRSNVTIECPTHGKIEL